MHINRCAFLLEEIMFGKILGIIFLILLGLFSICSCKVASWADQEIEEDLRKRERDEKKDL